MTAVFTSGRPGCHGGLRDAALRQPRRTWQHGWAACAAAVAALFVSVVGNATWAQAATDAKPAPEVWAKDLREEVVRINVTVTDMFGRQATRPMPITIFRPAGEGPHPLVVFNHGRAVDSKRAAQGRARAEHTARYLVGKGFVVMAPTRVGYWETYGDFDPEQSGPCNAKRFGPMS
ncbi:MAG: hypothetical protein K2W33_16715, partial [Burkholderiales bacterium]|nr:hypothetical protein [Burkholderiales bacterium]